MNNNIIGSSFFLVILDNSTRELRVKVRFYRKCLKKKIYGNFCRRITTSCWEDDENNIIYILFQFGGPTTDSIP